MTEHVVQLNALKLWFRVAAIFLALGFSTNALRARNITLAWDASPDPYVLGYRLHYGETSTLYTEVLDVGNRTNATVPALEEGHRYYFAVSAYSGWGPESDLSNEVQFTVPNGIFNSQPIGNESSVSLPEDQSVAVVLSGSDPDGDQVSYRIVTAPTHGSLSGQAPDLTYTAQSDFFGEDRFTFVVNDGLLNSFITRVSIMVTPVDDPPVVGSFTVTTIQDAPVQVVLSGFDPDGGSLIYSFGNPNRGTLVGVPPNLTYIPDPGFVGVDSFVFVANDGLRESDSATMSIAVEPRPDRNPRITSAKVTDSGVQIIWDVIAGRSYRVLYKDSLADAAWTTAHEGLVAGGSQLYWVDTDVFTTTSRFYIVELVGR